MFTVVERVVYYFLFLFNKYCGFAWTEDALANCERRLISKYVNTDLVEPTPIPTIDAEEVFTREKFLDLSKGGQSPVLIKGLFSDTKAVREWDLSYLSEAIGDFEVNIVEKSDDEPLTIRPRKFSAFAEHPGNSYLNNNHTILAEFPELFHDLNPQFDQLNQALDNVLDHVHIANLFIGGAKLSNRTTGSHMHAGGSGNFFCMIQGKKHWMLIDPKYSPLLKGRVSASGIHAQTLFDMPDLDLAETPQMLKCLPRYEVTLEPGDVLWNAPWWWHRIQNEKEASIGLAIRRNKVTRLNMLNNPLYTLSGRQYLLYNSWVIGAYERLSGRGKKFEASHEEKRRDNVLYQIEALCKKYPKSVSMDDFNLDNIQ